MNPFLCLSKSDVMVLLLQKNAVEILAQEMVTDLPSSFGKSFIDLSGFAMAKRAASKCFSRSGLSPADVDVLEVHDCFSCNEVSLHLLLQEPRVLR